MAVGSSRKEGKDPAATPQLWALYKEVQDYYDKGMRVPDDVTLLFSDDNWGNIRRLPGVGDKRKNRLLRNLGSIQRIARASVSELAPFVGQKTAQEIVEHFARQRALAEGG